MDNFRNIQELTFEFTDSLSDSDFIELVNSFVFEMSNPESGDVLSRFLEYCDCMDSYKKHLLDLRGGSYFLKCSGSNLQFIENLRISLLVSSYNRLKRKC